MAFHHVPTFLRSAIVRNPFCHGGIISPEDVLRLEVQYPNLFDNPDACRNSTTDAPKAGTSQEQQVEVTVQKASRSVKGTPKVTKSVTASPIKKKPAVSVPSQYHRNCLTSVKEGEQKTTTTIPRRRTNVPPKPLQAIPSQRFASMRNRKLIRPAQSFSLEDLRETLREVMRDDVLYNNQRTQNPSPYTEDLVKKFLGKKLQSAQSQKRSNIGNYLKSDFKLKGFSGDDESAINYYGQGDSGRAEQLSQRNSSRVSYHTHARQDSFVQTAKLSPHHPLVQQSTKEKVKRVKSAPGFIRSFPQPQITYQRGRDSSLQKRDEKKQVKWDDKGKRGNEEKGASEFRIHLCNKDKSPDMCTQESQTIACEEGMQSDGLKPSSSTRGAQIHIRSLKLKGESEMKTEPKPQQQPVVLPTSSFKHLLAARSITSRYKMKGLLRKQEAEFGKTKEKQRATFTCREREQKDASHEIRKASNASTTRVLEKIAKELVYVEILQQLHELKQRQTAAEGTQKEKHDDGTHSISFSSPPGEFQKFPPNFVPASPDDERKSESEKVPENKGSKSLVVTLKTPDLTPPTVPKAYKNKNSLSLSSNNVSLHTPELSPSLRKIMAMKKAQMGKQTSHHNLDTDCSEMSDFIASEVEKDEKKASQPESNKSGQESLKLVTPTLSKSSVKNVKPLSSKTIKPSHKRISEIEIPEPDVNTLSGVSTFHQDSHLIQENQPNPRENESQKQEAQMSTDPTVKDINEGSLELTNSKKEEPFGKSNENSSHQSTYSAEYLSEPLSVQDEEPDMNISGETVIDLLSEGEFIGAAYKSPGELSLRQQRHPWPRSSSKKLFEQFPPSVSNRSSFEDSKDDEGESGDLSFISSGLQIIAGSEHHHASFSVGEYLQR